MEEIKTIRLELPYVNESGVISLKEQTISFKKAIVKDERFGAFTAMKGNLVSYTMMLSMQIPEHIHAKLNNSFVPRSTDTTRDGTSYTDFKKTISSDSLERLTAKYREIILDCKWLMDIERMELRKVIFFLYKGNFGESKSKWNGIRLGHRLEIEYDFIVGYIDDKNVRFNEDRKVISSSYDKNIYGFTCINHTDEREEFFTLIYERFSTINKAFISEFSKIEEKNIDEFISALKPNKSLPLKDSWYDLIKL